MLSSHTTDTDKFVQIWIVKWRNSILFRKLFWHNVRKNILCGLKKNCIFILNSGNLPKVWDLQDNFFEQWRVRTIFYTEHFFNFKSDLIYLIHGNNENANWNKKIGCRNLQEIVWKKEIFHHLREIEEIFTLRREYIMSYMQKRLSVSPP